MDLIKSFLTRTSILVKLYCLGIPFVFDLNNFNKYIDVRSSAHFELLKIGMKVMSKEKSL